MKAMVLCMALLLALTVFASFANNSLEEREAMARKAELAKTYGDDQPQAQVDRFEAREFVPDNALNEREADLTRSLVLDYVGKH